MFCVWPVTFKSGDVTRCGCPCTLESNIPEHTCGPQNQSRILARRGPGAVECSCPLTQTRPPSPMAVLDDTPRGCCLCWARPIGGVTQDPTALAAPKEGAI